MEIKDIIDEIIAFRKELHRHPEIAGKEVWTCAAIRRRLAEISGVEILPPFLETDTVAFIRGNGPGKNVTLRADIDALTVHEETGCDYASEIPGMECNVPQGAFYIFPRYNKDIPSAKLAEILLTDGHVAVTPGTAFGPAGEGCIRISYAASEDMIHEGMARIKKTMSQL